MAWSFETDPDVEFQLRWADAFVRDEVEPLEALVDGDPARMAIAGRTILPGLQDAVKDRGLWAWHLEPAHGGQGGSLVNLALLNEVIGRSTLAPVVFGCQGADSGNTEILAAFGTERQRRRYLDPLVSGAVRSSFAATEPTGGADPAGYRTHAHLEQGSWVLNGEKWFASGASTAAFLIVIAVTEPERDARSRASVFIVDRETAGVEIVRDLEVPLHGLGRHAYLRFHDVRLGPDSLLGPRGGARDVLKARMGPARIHMAMRVSGMLLRAYAIMAERAASRTSQGSRLGDQQLVQSMLAQSWLDIEQYRLLVLRTAWKMDQGVGGRAIAPDISGLKALLPDVLNRVVRRAIQVNGALGLSTELPLMSMLVSSLVRGIGDGPTEVHLVNLARHLLAGVTAADERFGTFHLPALRAAAAHRYPQLA